MRLAAAQSDYETAAKLAVELTDILPAERDQLWLKAFDWNLRSGHWKEAEECLIAAMQANDQNQQARHLLVQLLNSQGRRYETRVHVVDLIRARSNTDDELMSLIDLSGPFELVSFYEIVNPSELSLLQLGKLRKKLTVDRLAPESLIPELELLSKRYPECEALSAFYGRVLLEQGDLEKLVEWSKSLPKAIQQEPEYWATVGGWLLLNRKYETAIRCFSEAIKRDPGQRESLRSLALCLDRLGRSSEAKIARESLAILDQIHRIAREADAEQCRWISDQLYKLGRPLESSAWLNTALRGSGSDNDSFNELRTRYSKAIEWEKRQQQEQVAVARTRMILGLDWQQYPLEPTIQPPSKPEFASLGEANPIDFIEESGARGIDVAYVSGMNAMADSFRLYQINGGGIAVLDYDRDGQTDVYFAQAGGPPNQANGSNPNQLFRQRDHQIFEAIPEAAGADDRGYSQGTCAADLNQDGFMDLYIANIGTNTLYINQGDGTFLKQPQILKGDPGAWTCSVAVADLNGDALPDLIEANYIDDPKAFEAICKDDFWSCQPQRFHRARDLIYVCQPDGRFELDEQFARRSRPDLSFAVVATNIDTQAGNDLFISVDGDMNFYWRSNQPQDQTTSEIASYQLVESATISGLAVGKGGNSQACMGIASGDFNRDGNIDFYVTNFFHEANNLFIQNTSGSFSDEIEFYGLAKPSYSALGFGTQAVDMNNDGWQDIAVLNGHVYNAKDDNIPFQQRPQLFSGAQDHFHTAAPANSGNYWNRPALGRTLATLDWNRDGRMDLIANHLDTPVALLTNCSVPNHWLQLELVGVECERDATGARIMVQCDSERWWGWCTGGDGYMCTNEPVIHFGLGHHANIDQVTIQWPNGKEQTLVDVLPNQRLLVIEGQSAIVQ